MDLLPSNELQSACKIQARDLVRTRRHIQKFYQMKTQLQAVSLRIQTLRSNQQMGEAMKGATRAMGMMNRSMNLPQVQRIMREFERESEVMDMKEEMMSDAVDEAMDDQQEGIGEEEEGDAILKEVLDSIGVDLGQSVSSKERQGCLARSVLTASSSCPSLQLADAPTATPNAPLAAPQRVAIGEGVGSGSGPSTSSNTKPGGGGGGAGGGGPSGGVGAAATGAPSGHAPSSSLGGGGGSDEDALQARLDQLRRD